MQTQATAAHGWAATGACGQAVMAARQQPSSSFTSLPSRAGGGRHNDGDGGGRRLFLSVNGGASARPLDLAAATIRPFAAHEHPPGTPIPFLPCLLCDTEHPNPSLIHLY